MGIGELGCLKISEAAKWGKTPKIQKKAEQAAESAMTEGFVAQVQAHAKKDAKKGVYMDHGYVQLSLSHMKQSISPDRSGPIAQVTSLLQEAAKEYDPFLRLLDMAAGNASVKGRITPSSQTAEVYSPDGEMIAGYNSFGGGWTTVQTKAETKFLSAAATVYAQAFREARAEMSAAQGPAQPAPPGGTSVDMRA